MGWFLPSYGRPQSLRKMLAAPGGWPDRVIVLVNEDDPSLPEYRAECDRLSSDPWYIETLPSGSRCADAHRYVSMHWPDEAFYGLLCDDQWPVTPAWYQTLTDAADDKFISTPNGEPHFPLLRNALVIGGDLVRAMGSLVPAPVRHNFEDNIWDQIAADFRLLHPLSDVFVEHRHWSRGQAEKDATYDRGSADFKSDKAIYSEWLTSPDRAAMNKRIEGMLGDAREAWLWAKT